MRTVEQPPRPLRVHPSLKIRRGENISGTGTINVELAPDGSHKLTQPQRGDTVDSVLRYVQFNPSDLLRAYREKIQRANLMSKQRESFSMN